MSNPLTFDFLFPPMHLPNDFLFLAMLLLVKFYLLYWLFCVCPRLLSQGCTSAHTPWKPSLLSPCFLSVSSQFSLIGCFPLFLDFLCDGIVWDPSGPSGLEPLYHSLFFSHTKGKRPWRGLGLAGSNGEGKKTSRTEV